MITKCLFPAAGYGTRFLPATKAMPKEMLPIMPKPLIQYGVEEANEAGCDVMAVITVLLRTTSISATSSSTRSRAHRKSLFLKRSAALSTTAPLPIPARMR